MKHKTNLLKKDLLMEPQYLYVTIEDSLPNVPELPMKDSINKSSNELGERPRDNLIRGVYEWNSNEKDSSIHTFDITG